MLSTNVLAGKRPLFHRESHHFGKTLAISERLIRIHIREWSRFVTMSFTPLLYLLAFRFGFSSLVDKVAAPNGQLVDYVAFVAPGMVSYSAYAGAVMDSQHMAFSRLHYTRIYDAVVTTPVGPFDIALGEIISAVIRGMSYSIALEILLLPIHLISFGMLIPTIPLLLITSFSSASIGLTAATLLHSETQLRVYTLLDDVALFLSTTFYPLTFYPRPIQLFIEFMPTYQGVSLFREIYFDAFTWSSVFHIAYLTVFSGVGLCVATYRLNKLLLI